MTVTRRLAAVGLVALVCSCKFEARAGGGAAGADSTASARQLVSAVLGLDSSMSLAAWEAKARPFHVDLAWDGERRCADTYRHLLLSGGDTAREQARFEAPPPGSFALPNRVDSSLARSSCTLRQISFLILSTNAAAQAAREESLKTYLAAGATVSRPGGSRRGGELPGELRWTAAGRDVRLSGGWGNGLGMEISAQWPARWELPAEPDFVDEDRTLVAEALALAGLDSSLTSAVGRLTGATRAVRGDSVAVAFEQWMHAADTLAGDRRAAALFAADIELGRAALVFSGDSSVAATRFRSRLAALGASFRQGRCDDEDPRPCWSYVGNWLSEAIRADRRGRVAAIAMVHRILGFDQCQGDHVKLTREAQELTRDAEELLPRLPADARTARTHFRLGELLRQVAEEGPPLRDSALRHYRQGLALDSTSAWAKRAWIGAWALISGLSGPGASCDEGE